MEPKNISDRHEHLLKCLAHLPQKILSMHGMENLTEFVLHDLCNKHCFDLSRAAYFIDNPDFDYLKGIAGFDHQEDFIPCEDLWSDPKQFTTHMKNCAFNQRVRSIEKSSIKKSRQSEEDLIYQLAQELEFQEPIYYFWDIKNENQGLFIFEYAQDKEEISQEIYQGLSLLGFCPVF